MEKSIKDTNSRQIESDQLLTKMITKPDSVNIHDVMIAAQKAQISLDFTKSILQKAVQAYQKITSLR
jgi:flagellar hook-basal body complex protein FliE